MGISSEVRVGLMAAAGLVVLVLMVFMIGDIDLFSPTYPVTFKFGHVDGLLVGSKVAISGVKAGKVDRVEVKGGVVHVRCRIESAIRIPRNAKVTIDTMGLMGEKYVGILMPDGRPDERTLEANEEFDAIDPVRMTRLMSEGDEILRKVHISIDSLNQVLADPKFIESMKNSAYRVEDTMASINLTARGFDHRLDELQGRVERFLDRMDDAGIQVVDLLEESREGLADTVENVRILTREFRDLATGNRAVVDRAIKDFSETAATLRALMRDVEGGGQTAIDFKQMLRNLRETTARILEIFDDGKIGVDLKGTTGHLRNVLEKADRLLGGFGGFKSKLGYTTRYNLDRELSSNDLNFDLSMGGRDLRMGVRDIGHGSDLDFQLGMGALRAFPSVKPRVGIIKSKMGVGFDYSFMKNSLSMIDIIDTRDTTVDSTSLYRVGSGVSILTRVEDALSKAREYNVGLRYDF